MRFVRVSHSRADWPRRGDVHLLKYSVGEPLAMSAKVDDDVYVEKKQQNTAAIHKYHLQNAILQRIVVNLGWRMTAIGFPQKLEFQVWRES